MATKISNHTQRLIIAIAFIPVFLFAIFSPFDYHLIFLGICFGLSIALSYEIVHLGKKHEGFRLPYAFPMIVNVLIILYTYLYHYGYLSDWVSLPELAFFDMILLITLWLFLPQFTRIDLTNSLVSIGVGWVAVIFGGVFIAAGVEVLAYDPFFFFYLLSIAWIGDTACYYSGKLLGKHKLNLPASPNKTLEGYLGGFLGTIGLVYLLFWGLFDGVLHILPRTQELFTMYQEYGIISNTIQDSSLSLAIWNLPWWGFILLTGFLLFTAFVGDLIESIVKRSAVVKDSGYIPGHGGVFDAFDSFLLLLPVGAFMLHVVKNGYF